MPITKGFRALVDEAMAQVTTHSVDQVRQRLDDPALQLVDIRDARELEREGTLPGAINAPRGSFSSRPVKARTASGEKAWPCRRQYQSTW